MSFSGFSSEDEGFDDGQAAAAGAANAGAASRGAAATFMQNSKDLF